MRGEKECELSEALLQRWHSEDWYLWQAGDEHWTADE